MTSSVEQQSCPADAASANSFTSFFERLKTGDEAAALELVRRYEPALRLEIRLRMRDPRLRRLLEPADISQSVLRSFFARAGAGQFEVHSPQQLLGLLMTIARNKVAKQARRQHAHRRDNRRQVSLDNEEFTLTSRDPSPSRQVIGRETLNEFNRRLSFEEQRIAEMRSQGHDWALIAEVLGGTAQARRKQLARAMRRVGREIASVEADDE